MEIIVRAAASALIRTATAVGKPVIPPANSTLNQKFDVQASIALTETEIPVNKYVFIGNGGHRMITGAGGVSYPEVIRHLARHSGLYNHLPFVMRLVTDDIPATQRAQYRIRKIETHDQKSYVCYYGKLLDTSATTPALELRTITDGVTTSQPFNYTLSDLSPTPPAAGSSGVTDTEGDYIASTAKIPFIMTAADVDEFLNVANILYGTDNLAIISEIALASGVDRAVSGDFNGTSASYTEVIGCQINSFIGLFFAAKFNNNGLRVNFDLGSVEPLSYNG